MVAWNTRIPCGDEGVDFFFLKPEAYSEGYGRYSVTIPDAYTRQP